MITSLQVHKPQYTNVSVRQTAAKVACSGGSRPSSDDLFIMELPHRSCQEAHPLTRPEWRGEEPQLGPDRFHLSVSDVTQRQSAKVLVRMGPVKAPLMKVWERLHEETIHLLRTLQKKS